MRDINDKKKMAEQTKARWQFVIVLVVITIGMFMAGAARATSAETFAATSVNALQWAYEPPVYFNANLHPYTTVPAIEYALWSIKERTGLSGYYAGQTSATVITGAVVVRWVTRAQMLSQSGCTCSGYTQWAYDGAGSMTSGEILISTESVYPGKDLQWVALHELGHAFAGDMHHSGENAVFSDVARHYPTDYTLTTADVYQLPYSNRSLCHAELTRENDIYLPSVLNAQSVMLRYQGNYEWKVAYMSNNPVAPTCNVASMDSSGYVTINDLRSVSTRFTNVILKPIADNTWILDYAE